MSFSVLSFYKGKCEIFAKRVRLTAANNTKFIFSHSFVFARVIHKFFNAHFMRIRNEGNMRIDPAGGMYSRDVCVYALIAKI